MKMINCWNDLLPYGIDPLTGEACGLMYRLLCDVTTSGKKIIEKTLGCRLDLPGNWNSGKPDDPHVGCIMLAYEFLIPIGIFALLENGCTEVWHCGDSLIGIEPTDHFDHPDEVKKVYKVTRVLRYGGEYATHYPDIHSLSGVRDNHLS